jgi:hypothetical protein
LQVLPRLYRLKSRLPARGAKLRLRFLGDSYDLVKQSLLCWLAQLGPWKVHPMFTAEWSRADATAFSRLLRTPLLSHEVLNRTTDRSAYFSSARACRDHLFLDPDTGLGAKTMRGAKAPSYLFLAELDLIARQRPWALTLLFDQAVQRGSEKSSMEHKLALLSARGLNATAYVSHACFLLVGLDADLCARAHEVLVRESGLPKGRLPSRTARA